MLVVVGRSDGSQKDYTKRYGIRGNYELWEVRMELRAGVNAPVLRILPSVTVLATGMTCHSVENLGIQKTKLSFESPRLARSTIDLKLRFVSRIPHLTTLVTHRPRCTSPGCSSVHSIIDDDAPFYERQYLPDHPRYVVQVISVDTASTVVLRCSASVLRLFLGRRKSELDEVTRCSRDLIRDIGR